jgi:DNA repair exonuclease SbcCD ATPase subunit
MKGELLMDWLKELLKKAGVEEAKLDGVIADIGKELPKRFIPKDKYNETAEAKKRLETDLAARDAQLEELKKAAGTSEELKKQIEALQADNKKAAEEWQTKLAQMQLDFALERALAAAKAKNPKAVKALLDLEQVKLDGDKLLGLDEQLKELQKSDSYLFGDSTPGKVGSGTNPPGAGNAEVNPWKKETFNLTLQGKILRDDPAKATRMKAEAGIK